MSFPRLLILALLAGISMIRCSVPENMLPEIYFQLQKDFVTPHDTNTVWCYYYWINDDISIEGVTRDMEAMKEFGIGTVLIGNINPDLTDGRVPLFSDEWWDISVHAVVEGHRLGIDVGFFNCPGWSQSGGPWISHEEAMRYLVYSESEVKGPNEVSLQLEKPELKTRISNHGQFMPDPNEYQDTHVLAFKTIQAESIRIDDKNASISCIPFVDGCMNLIDGNTSTETLFDSRHSSEYTISIEADDHITARSILFHPAKSIFKCQIDVFANDGGGMKLLRTIDYDRSNTRVNVGPDTHGPAAFSLPHTTANSFQLVVSNIARNTPVGGFADIVITEAAVLEEYVEKTLGKMHPTPLPAHDSYLWEQQSHIINNDLIVDEVYDITEFMDVNGKLTWDVPAGSWTILRIGMTPTGTKNHPAAPQGTGYEVDKASAELAKYHFKQFLGEIIRRIPEESLPALKYVVADSYEMGPQNWTDNFDSRFKDKFGYDPLRFLPAFSGRIVGSVEETERFLWDLRRAIADDIAYEYVGGLRQISNEYGLKLWLENYGHWGFPSEFLMYGGQSDLVSGEYWNEGSLGNIECKSASSAANIYGKPFVSAEAWTAAQLAYKRHPAMLKRRGDWSLTEGINHHVLHLYIHQPDNERVPGVNAWFSTEFNRHNTWFKQGKYWIDYLRRCQHLLQQGHYSADVCYFIGEDAPKMTGTQDPALPAGYSYDYINAEVIIDNMYVENGRLMLPHGMSYSLMVLPKSKGMRPEVLRKIEELVKQGAAVLGPSPEHSPSLQGYPGSDQLVSEIADRMWVDDYKNDKLVHTYGNGYVMDGLEIQEALDILNIPPDVVLNAHVPVLWTHRTLPGMEIYFLTNQGEQQIQFKPSFRVNNMKPQLWDAVTGEIRSLNDFTVLDDHIEVPLTMESHQSWFVVFTDQSNQPAATGYTSNFPDPEVLTELKGPWSVNFLNQDIGPVSTLFWTELSDWTDSNNDKIKYYSGTAIYRTSFVLNDLPDEGNLFLNLGQVGVMAAVTLNGERIGNTWIAPFRIPVYSNLNVGENVLEVEVVNTWRNQLIRDASLPEAQWYTWTSVSDAAPNELLQSSGLLGPVTIERFK